MLGAASYCASLHSVSWEHARSLVIVGGIDWKCDEVSHVVSDAQTRAVCVLAMVLSYCVPYEHVSKSLHTTSDVAVPGTLMYCPGACCDIGSVQVVCGVHVTPSRK